MTRAQRLLKVTETLAEVGDHFEKTVKALKDAGFMMASFSKGTAGTPATIALDNGLVITIDKDSGAYDISTDQRTQSAIHPKQRFFTPGDLLQTLALVKK